MEVIKHADLRHSHSRGANRLLLSCVSFGSSFNEAVSEIVRGSGVPVADLCWSFTSLAQLLPLCFRGVLYLHRSALPTYMGSALPTTHI